MRFLIVTITFFLVAAVIKIDLTEGTVPLAAYQQEDSTKKCADKYKMDYITMITMDGDTVQGLLSTYSTGETISYPEKLAHFYQLNPHLQKQSLVPGERVRIPIYEMTTQDCSK